MTQRKLLNHAGGCQVTDDDLLVFGIENVGLQRYSESLILIYDISEPTEPKIVGPKRAPRAKHGILRRSSPTSNTAGAVGLTKLSYFESFGANTTMYMLAVGNWDAARIDFYLLDRFLNVAAEYQMAGLARPDKNKWQNINLFASPGPPPGAQRTKSFTPAQSAHSLRA